MFFKGYGDHRDQHRVDRRQRQMCIRDSINAEYGYSSEEHITLEEELKVLSLYVHIEQLRFREEFGFTIEMSGDINAEQILVPPLIVQPFLENAIWHGLMQKEGEKELVLDVARKRGLLQITLRDNGIGRKKAGANKSGAQMKRKSMAIELTTKRLEILNSKSDLRNTVSYTHLRAHETVLDLVCRLLLEKKNINN
eukprot:TRINITY_DN10685_c0_g1_i1.p1 TRINITY_DN10685_c0_g1~~TRINITY_DN10685_c0_g1_i1.p1  ORF type:complete len:196 (+),score=14.69 TRINITY_DN10685_c0_g1_i1:75-662(+)